MSDQKQSTPQPTPETWQELAPFRESFLRYLTAPGDAEAVRKTGSLVFEMVLDYCRLWPQPEEAEGVTELRAIIRDLKCVEQQLRRNVAGSLEASHLGEPELRLALKAREWAGWLGILTVLLEKEIAAVTPGGD